jgi:hypothetical protein
MSPEGAGSVTCWLGPLQTGDSDAARQLWGRYIADLVRLARAKLRDSLRTVADEEDVALSAFDSFCRGVKLGRYPLLEDRDNLWRLLVTITARKAADQVQREHRQKRGRGRIRRASSRRASAAVGASNSTAREPRGVVYNVPPAPSPMNDRTNCTRAL